MNASNTLMDEELFKWALVHGAVGSPYNHAGQFDNTNTAILSVLRSPSYQAMFTDIATGPATVDRSIMSPAAYFVDLMRFVDEVITEPNKIKAPNDLRSRRPDLCDIKLDRANTETTKPYIAAVNDVMLRWLRARLEQAGRRRGKIVGSGDPLANVAVTNFVGCLPYDARLAEIRAYLGEMGCDLASLFKRTGLAADNYGREELGLSHEAIDRLSLSAPEKSWARGAAEEQADPDQISVRSLMGRLDITRSELEMLVYQGIDEPDRDKRNEQLRFLGVSLFPGKENKFPEIVPGRGRIETISETRLQYIDHGSLPKELQAIVGEYHFVSAKLGKTADWVPDGMGNIWGYRTPEDANADANGTALFAIGNGPSGSDGLAIYELTEDRSNETIINLGPDQLAILETLHLTAKALGWSYADVDWGYFVANGTPGNSFVFDVFAILSADARRTGKSVEEIAAFKCNLKTLATGAKPGTPSQFDRLFGQPDVVAMLPDAVRENPDQVAPAGGQDGNARLLPVLDPARAVVWNWQSDAVADTKIAGALALAFDSDSETIKACGKFLSDRIVQQSGMVPLTLQNLTSLYRLMMLPGILHLSLDQTMAMLWHFDAETVLMEGLTTTHAPGLDDPRAWRMSQRELGFAAMSLEELQDTAAFLRDNDLSALQLAFVAGELSDDVVAAEYKTGGALDPGFDGKALDTLLAKHRAEAEKEELQPNDPIFAGIPLKEARAIIKNLLSEKFLSEPGVRIGALGNYFDQEMRKEVYRIVGSSIRPTVDILMQGSDDEGSVVSLLLEAGILSEEMGAVRDFPDDLDLEAVLAQAPERTRVAAIKTVLEHKARVQGIIAYLTAPAEKVDAEIKKAHQELAALIHVSQEQLVRILVLLDKGVVRQDPGDKVMGQFRRLAYATRVFKLSTAQLSCIKTFPSLITNKALHKDDTPLSDRLKAPAMVHLIARKHLIEKAWEAWGSGVETFDSVLDDKSLNYLHLAEGWDLAVLKQVAETLKPSEIQSTPIEKLEHIAAVFDIAADLKVAPQVVLDLRKLGTAPLLDAKTGKIDKTAVDLRHRLSEVLYLAMRARVTASKWPELKTKLRTPLDHALREALGKTVLFATSNADDIRAAYGEVTNLSELYGYLLIDVEAEGATEISPIKQGLNTLQLYVHRCRIGLEPAAKRKIPAKRWSWMEHYRVWQANRQVFLYPESYLHPSMRPDKTPEFQRLEGALLQCRTDPQAMESAIASYLAEVEALADMQIVATCATGTDDGPDLRDIYFLATNATADGTDFFLRRAVLDQSVQPDQIVRWDPWQPLGLKIPSRRPTMIHAHGRLFLFWAETEVRKETGPEDKDGKTKNIKALYSTVKYAFETAANRWIRPRTLMAEKRVMDTDTTLEKGFRYFKDNVAVGQELTWRDGIETKEIWAAVEAVVRDPGKAGEQILVVYGDKNLNPFDSFKYPGNKDLNWQKIRPMFAGLLNGELLFTPTEDISTLLNRDDTNDSVVCGTNPAHGAVALNVRGARRMFVFDNGDDAYFFVGHREYVADLEPTIQYSDAYGLALEARARFRKGKDGMISLAESLSVAPMASNAMGRLSRKLLAGGLDELLTYATQADSENWYPSFVPDKVIVTSMAGPNGAPSKEVIDDFVRGFGALDFRGAYGLYFWELFFHLPMLAGEILGGARKFEAAQGWYNRTFDPAAPTDAQTSLRERIWQFLPFRQLSDETLHGILGDRADLRAYRDDPLNPHAIARLRPDAYRRSVVMSYVDNLIDWGDDLFAQANWEALGQARMLYVMARDLLGQRPDPGAGGSLAKSKTYTELMAAESRLDLAQIFAGRTQDEIAPVRDDSVLHAFDIRDIDYFAVPENEDFLKIWDRIEDRLYKIRHGQTLDGQEMHLDLFQPKIDPNDLIGHWSGASDLPPTGPAAEIPNYRFRVLIERARAAASLLIQLGGGLQSAIEKTDAEALALFRATHEKTLLDLSEELLQRRIDDAEASLDALHASHGAAKARKAHYETLLKKPYSKSEEQVVSDHRSGIINMMMGNGVRIDAVVAHLIPTIFGFSDGGFQPGSSVSEAASLMDGLGQIDLQKSALHSTVAQFERRTEDWSLQEDQAEHDIAASEAQIAAAKARLKVAQQGMVQHLKRVETSTQLKEFLSNKFSSKDLYSWSATQVSQLYSATFQMAVSLARTAQKAMNFELDRDQDFLGDVAWDNNRQGLLAGEGLMVALERMNQAYLDQDERLLEMEKTVSLLNLAPEALLDLKATGSCRFSLTERHFDHDFPGHYRRKIKSVSVSVLAMVGPYQNIQATLTQTDNQIAMRPDLAAVKAMLKGDTSKSPAGAVRTNWRPNQHIAITKGVEDSGVFELNLQDGRYVPFEGTGAVSGWKLDMPQSNNRIDLASVSDVVFRIRYSAKAGPGNFADDVRNLPLVARYAGFRLVSLRNEFATQWQGAQDGRVEFSLGPKLFPQNLVRGSLKLGEKSPSGGARMVRLSAVPLPGKSAPKLALNGAAVDGETGSVACPSGLDGWFVTGADDTLDLAQLADILLVLPYEGRLG